MRGCAPMCRTSKGHGWITWLAAGMLVAKSVVALAQPAGLSGHFSGLVYNRSTSTFDSVLTLSNNGSASAYTPLTIVISTGNSGVTVAGAPDGQTYSAVIPGGSIAPGKSAQVVVAFSDPNRIAFTPKI